MILQTVSFEQWLSQIKGKLETDVQAQDYFLYYKEGLTPEEAIEMVRENT